MKKIFRRIHLYLGLAAGAVILIACLTGALLVFQKELELGFNKNRYFTQVQAQRLPLDSLVREVKKAYPDAKVNGAKVYTDRSRNVEVSITLQAKGNAGKEINGNKHAGGKGATGGVEHKQGENARNMPATEQRGEGRAPGLIVFIDPYTGKVKELYNNRESFFFKVMSLHRWLLGTNEGVGKYIVGISTLIFLFILLTGIILWWPKTKKILKQRMTIKGAAGWKRLNHDLHIVLGFYSAIFLFIFAFTALPMSFQWFNKGIYTVTGSPLKNPEPPKSIFAANTRPIGFNLVLSKAMASLPYAGYYNITMARDSAACITVSALGKHAVHETAPDAIYLDQYSGAVIGKQLYKDRTLGTRVRSTFRPVHVGSIWGTQSKIIALIVCLLGVSFPVTGVTMWLNRSWKRKKKPAISSELVKEIEVAD